MSDSINYCVDDAITSWLIEEVASPNFSELSDDDLDEMMDFVRDQLAITAPRSLVTDIDIFVEGDDRIRWTMDYSKIREGALQHRWTMGDLYSDAYAENYELMTYK